MTWLLLALGFFLLLSGLLGQAYSLKTKRGVLPPETPHLEGAHPANVVPGGVGADCCRGGADRSPSWSQPALRPDVAYVDAYGRSRTTSNLTNE